MPTRWSHYKISHVYYCGACLGDIAEGSDVFEADKTSLMLCLGCAKQVGFMYDGFIVTSAAEAPDTDEAIRRLRAAIVPPELKVGGTD